MPLRNAFDYERLGYILLRYQCGRPEGHEIIESVSPVFGLNTMLVVLAEGVAIANICIAKIH